MHSARKGKFIRSIEHMVGVAVNELLLTTAGYIGKTVKGYIWIYECMYGNMYASIYVCLCMYECTCI